MNILLLITAAAAAVIGAIVTFEFLKIDVKQKAKSLYQKTKDRSYAQMSGNASKKFNYDAMEEKMTASGIKYRMGNSFSPFDYEIFRAGISIGIGLLGMLLNPYYFLPGVLIGMLLVPYYFRHEDKYDNNEMLPDIVQIYGIIGLQLKSGIFLSKVIYECYRATENPRLKKALLEFSLDIENFSDVKGAAVSFRKKFNNSYIDTFAKTIEQADDTGNAVQIFEDIEKQMKNLNEAVTMKQENKAKRVGFVFETVIFLGIMLFMVYLLYQWMTAGNSLF